VYLIFPVVLLREFQYAVTESADLPVGGVALVHDVLHLECRPFPLVLERRLQDLKHLREEWEIK